MKIYIVVEAYKGCIENAYAFAEKGEAVEKKMIIQGGKDFNVDEDDAQIFEVHVEGAQIFEVHVEGIEESLSLAPQMLRRMLDLKGNETMAACDGQTYFKAQLEANGNIRIILGEGTKIEKRTKIEKQLAKVQAWLEPHFEDTPGLEEAWNTVRSRAE